MQLATQRKLAQLKASVHLPMRQTVFLTEPGMKAVRCEPVMLLLQSPLASQAEASAGATVDEATMVAAEVALASETPT